MKKPGRKPLTKIKRAGNLRAQFVDEYMIDNNATQAAIRAGYSEASARNQGTRLMHDDDILSEINKRGALIAESRGISAERVMQEFANLAFLDPIDLFNPNGTMKSLEEMPEMARRAIGGIELRELSQIDTPEGPIRVQLRKIKLIDKKGALDSIAKIMGLMRDKVDVTVKARAEDIEKVINDELKRFGL